jgi:hypothetical protein
MDDQELYRRARERVEEIKGFYVHLITYLLVNAGLFVINILTSPGTYWFVWPLFGWGIGIIAHAIGTFGPGMFGRAWEERKVREIVEQERRRSGERSAGDRPS